MQHKTMLKIASALAALLVSTACMGEKEGQRTVIEKPGGTITVIEDAGQAAGEPSVSVEGVDRYENMQITDWLDEDTVIVSKVNEALGKMSLAELSGEYPRSLYLYHLDTNEYALLKARENAFLGEAALSADKKHLIYSEGSLGDPVYYVMNLDTLEAIGLVGEPIGGAMSARWAGNEIIGAAYSGGAYLADTAGKISTVAELQDEALVIARKARDKIYYNTNADETLRVLDLSTRTRASLNMTLVRNVIPSPNGDQLLVLQSVGDKLALVLCDENGDNRKTIAEGAELGGVSWSPDQRLISYRLKADVNGTTAHGIYLYDLLSDESTRIAVGIGITDTNWSPSGEALAYAEWNGTRFDSHVVHVAYSVE